MKFINSCLVLGFGWLTILCLNHCATTTEDYVKNNDTTVTALDKIEKHLRDCPELVADVDGVFRHHETGFLFAKTIDQIQRRDLKRFDVDSQRPLAARNCGQDVLLSYHHPDFAFVIFLINEPDGTADALLHQLIGGGKRQALAASFRNSKKISLTKTGFFSDGRYLFVTSKGNMWDPTSIPLGQEWFVFVRKGWGLAIYADYPFSKREKLQVPIRSFLRAFITDQPANLLQ